MKKCHLSIYQKVNNPKLTLFKTILNIFIICYARQILFLQLDFLLQKSAIEESITGIRESLTGHKILFYLKFHCELNHS